MCDSSIHFPTIGEHFNPRPICLASFKFYSLYSKYVGYLSRSKKLENYSKDNKDGVFV